MLFQKRIDRAFKRQAEMNREREEAKGKEYDPREPDIQPTPADVMEKGDLPALLISALIVIVPVVLIALLVMAGAAWLFFRP